MYYIRVFLCQVPPRISPDPAKQQRETLRAHPCDFRRYSLSRLDRPGLCAGHDGFMSAHLTHRRAVILMLVSVAGFTANILLARLLGELQAANAWLISVARFVVGLLIVMTVYRADFRPANLWSNPQLIKRGLLGALGVYLTYLCVIKLGAGRATFIGNTYVIWGALLAAWLLRERLQLRTLLGSFATLIGLGLLTNIFSTTTGPGLYDLIAIVAAVNSAYVVVTIRQLHGTEHSSTIFAAQCAYGLVVCTVPAVTTYEPISLLAWGVLVLASLTAGIAQLAMTRAFRDLAVAEGSLLQMLVPLGVAAGGWAFFQEKFTLLEMAGAALILAGTALTVARPKAGTVG
jgi:drug/metabolite transporter (DMT)-like permease